MLNRLRLTRRVRNSRGQAMVEAAIILPLLLLATFAIIDFAVLFYIYLALENGVSQAVRYGITGESSATMSREESMKTVMRQAAPTLTIKDEAFQFSHLSGASWVAGTGGQGDIARLTVTYTHTVIVLAPFFTDGKITFRVESSMKNEDRFN